MQMDATLPLKLRKKYEAFTSIIYSDTHLLKSAGKLEKSTAWSSKTRRQHKHTVSWLNHLLEDIFDGYFLSLPLPSANNYAHLTVPFTKFVYEYLSKRTRSSEDIKATCMDLIFTIEAASKRDDTCGQQALLFSKFLSENFSSRDLLFFLYLRSVVEHLKFNRQQKYLETISTSISTETVQTAKMSIMIHEFQLTAEEVDTIIRFVFGDNAEAQKLAYYIDRTLFREENEATILMIGSMKFMSLLVGMFHNKEFEMFLEHAQDRSKEAKNNVSGIIHKTDSMDSSASLAVSWRDPMTISFLSSAVAEAQLNHDRASPRAAVGSEKKSVRIMVQSESESSSIIAPTSRTKHNQRVVKPGQYSKRILEAERFEPKQQTWEYDIPKDEVDFNQQLSVPSPRRVAPKPNSYHTDSRYEVAPSINKSLGNSNEAIIKDIPLPKTPPPELPTLKSFISRTSSKSKEAEVDSKDIDLDETADFSEVSSESGSVYNMLNNSKTSMKPEETVLESGNKAIITHGTAQSRIVPKARFPDETIAEQLLSALKENVPRVIDTYTRQMVSRSELKELNFPHEIIYAIESEIKSKMTETTWKIISFAAGIQRGKVHIHDTLCNLSGLMDLSCSIRRCKSHFRRIIQLAFKMEGVQIDFTVDREIREFVENIVTSDDVREEVEPLYSMLVTYATAKLNF